MRRRQNLSAEHLSMVLPAMSLTLDA